MALLLPIDCEKRVNIILRNPRKIKHEFTNAILDRLQVKFDGFLTKCENNLIYSMDDLYLRYDQF